ncbi:ComF family protein [Carboxylicivirga mesophila]|uniref:ComF family protein n=1 Tax=Carboxylicivirga mesophila TaxID=1166478 RepID=A0ABS5KDR5_9BACT|nr:phosphoribosyltransferase family protein [Carboxylicivirga mesophila]MBS2213049.1 ComF family protein [Carboxylicivirga mesophila]
MHIVANIMDALSTLGELFYPPVCSSCGNHLFKNEAEICQMCIRRLPRTYFEKQPFENQISIMMWGRCRVECGFALFYYRKGERVQQLLHDVKYRGNQKLGVELGKQLGKLINQSRPSEFDELIPIPLHPRKKRIRGFNQAEVICNGLAEALSIPVNSSDVYRKTHTASQTKKGRFERWQNVEDIFGVTNPEYLKNKHLLVVDDVITTGSTMEACINQLTAIEGVKVSIATIACAAL